MFFHVNRCFCKKLASAGCRAAEFVAQESLVDVFSDAARENVAELLEGVPAEPSQSIAEFLCKSHPEDDRSYFLTVDTSDLFASCDP